LLDHCDCVSSIDNFERGETDMRKIGLSIAEDKAGDDSRDEALLFGKKKARSAYAIDKSCAKSRFIAAPNLYRVLYVFS